MARRGGRRGRRSRSKQRSKGAGSRSSKAKSSKKKSSNRRGSGKTSSRSKASSSKKSTSKKKATTRRSAPKKNKRGSGVSQQKKQAAKTVKKVVSQATKPQAAQAKAPTPKKAPPKKVTAPSAKKSIQQKAAERHAQFKKTGVQTYGGTRNVNSYSKSELDKLQSYARTEGKTFGMTIGQPNVKYPGKTGLEKLPADQVPTNGLVMNSVGQYVTPAQLAKDDADAGPSIGRSIASGINTIKNNVVPFGRRIPDLKTDYTVAQEARLKATTPYKTGQRTKTGAIAGRGSSNNMQIQQPTAPTRESVEQLAAMSDALPPDSIRDTPTPEQTTPTPNTLIQPERFIDIGGGQQVSADNMSDYLASLRNTWDQQSQAYQSQIGTLQGQIGDFQTDVGNYQSQIGGYQGQVSDFERTIADYRQQVGGYESSLGDYRSQVSGLQSDIGGYRDQIGGLQSDIGGYRGQIGQLQSDIGGYQGQIGNLQGDIKGLRGDITNYQDRERQAREMQIQQSQRQRVAQSYGMGKKKAKVGGVKTGRIEEMARGMGPRATFNRSGLRISSLNI